MAEDVVTMFRPTGPEELELVAQSGWRRWPPRLPEQPIFYPVTNQSYAERIAREWNVPESGAGYVTRFKVRRSFVEKYETHQVGAEEQTEWWIPAEDLEALNKNVVGLIEVVATFQQAQPNSPLSVKRRAGRASNAHGAARYLRHEVRREIDDFMTVPHPRPG